MADGHYDLISNDGSIIIPQCWEMLIKPDASITMHMWPMPEAEAAPPPPRHPPRHKVPPSAEKPGSAPSPSPAFPSYGDRAAHSSTRASTSKVPPPAGTPGSAPSPSPALPQYGVAAVPSSTQDNANTDTTTKKQKSVNSTSRKGKK